jgi:hypothetical protein
MLWISLTALPIKSKSSKRIRKIKFDIEKPSHEQWEGFFH